ncbi:MAG: RagB/SusD family nutrient uptake outer membrane protein [Dysgonamonadaceae bacterium]|jgi:hypothetical protein|nr:RagB/SusD family nutrient uptake outer membrane protein [Dysgonamonadaceae bacterium]
MKNISKFILSGLLTLSLNGCDFLDIVPDMIATIEDNAFSMRSQAEKFFFTCYSYIPYSGTQDGDPALLGGDEIWLSAEYGGGAPKQLALGNQRSNDPYMDFWRGAQSGRNLYRGISDCNIFLANIDRVPDISVEEKNNWIAEVNVLKAWFHFYLIRMYGPIPIKDVNLSVTDDTETTHVYRNTMDECVEYCISKMDEVLASNNLMLTAQDPSTQLGRITKGVALTMRAKMLVTFASPLFNGNTDYVGLKDNRGIEIFNPSKSEEEKTALWKRAAEACKEAIDFYHSPEIAVDHLYRFTGTQFGNISDRTRLKLSIRGSMVERWNEEILWADSRAWAGSPIQDQAHPRDFNATNANGQTSNRNNYAVPLKIVTGFYTNNGVPINEDKTWNYNARFTPRTVGTDQQYFLAVGEQTAGMFFDREPRLYASIGFDRGIWFGHGSTSETGQFPKARGASDDYSKNTIQHSWNMTGMWPKKQIHWLTAFSGSTTITRTTYPFPIFRLPDLYLMYAEALNEANNTQAARDEAIQYINIVRERAGIPDVKTAWDNYSNDPDKYKRQAGLRDIIRQETLNEFVFEGHRFWDIRRWKLAMQEYNKPITGWNLVGATAAEYYVETWIYTRKFTPKDYFWPIHDGEILRNKNTLQNYGW